MSTNSKSKRETAPDPFDPARLRLTESAQIGVKKAVTVISCNKPGRQQFVRTHPDESFRMQTALFTDEVNREAYLVAPELWNELAGEVVPTYLFEATGNIPEPEWPALTFHEMLRVCFSDRFIDSMGHPVLRALRGEV